nr:hypothetical protein [uncultured Prevotella sp.]
MGTSQSLKLKTSPNWSSAKKAMTKIVRHRNEVTQPLVRNFLRQLSRAIVADSHGSYGRSGGKVASNFINVISSIRKDSLQSYLGQVAPDTNYIELTVREAIALLAKHVSNPHVEQDHCTLDDIAARTAFEKLLETIFLEVETVNEIDQIIHDASEEQLEAWMIEFQVNYIMELNGVLFDSFIFSKNADPDQIGREIRDYVRTEINEACLENMKYVTLFSEEGRQFIETLTQQILKIWSQE